MISPFMRTVCRLVTESSRDKYALRGYERRSLFLHRAIAERLASDPEDVLEQARTTLRRMLERRSRAAPLLDEWTRLLRRPTAELIEVLIDPAPHARELRHVTPFAGVFKAAERAAIYRAFARAERAA